MPIINCALTCFDFGFAPTTPAGRCRSALAGQVRARPCAAAQTGEFRSVGAGP
jgi:hypothetical protein